MSPVIDAVTSKAGGFFTAAGGAAKWMALLLVIMLVLGGIIWFIWRIYKYNVTCVVFSKRKDGDRIIVDKGGYFKSWTTRQYHFRLKKLKVKIQPPRFDFLQQTKLLFLRQVSMDSFVPIEYNEELLKDEDLKVFKSAKNIYIPVQYKLFEDVTLKTTEADVGNWAALTMREVRQRFQTQSMLEKYLPAMLFVVSIFIVTILIYILLKKFDALVPAFTQAAEAIANAQAAGQAVPV